MKDIQAIQLEICKSTAASYFRVFRRSDKKRSSVMNYTELPAPWEQRLTA